MATKPKPLAVVPKHITRPFGARECLAVHRVLDMSAWVMGTGKEVFVLKGKIVDDAGEKPSHAVLNYNDVTSVTRVAGLIKILYKIDLLVK